MRVFGCVGPLSQLVGSSSRDMSDRSSLTRHQTHVPCIGRQTVDQWTSRFKVRRGCQRSSSVHPVMRLYNYSPERWRDFFPGLPVYSWQSGLEDLIVQDVCSVPLVICLETAGCRASTVFLEGSLFLGLPWMKQVFAWELCKGRVLVQRSSGYVRNKGHSR